MKSTTSKENADTLEHWQGTYLTKDTGPLSSLIIEATRKGTRIRATASSFPDNLDLGESQAEVYFASGRTPALIAHFSTGKTKSTMVLSLNAGGEHALCNMVVCTLYVKYPDDRGQQYFQQRFNTEMRQA